MATWRLKAATKQTSLDKNEHISRTLACLLRHKARKWGVPITKDGYVVFASIPKLHAFCRWTEKEIREAVDKADQRFSFNTDGTMIRANDCHNKKFADLKIPYSEIKEPINITYRVRLHLLDSVLKNGATVPPDRIYMHFGCPDDPLGEPDLTEFAYLKVNMKQAMADGIKFYRSSSKLISSKGVNGVFPPKYFIGD